MAPDRRGWEPGSCASGPPGAAIHAVRAIIPETCSIDAFWLIDRVSVDFSYSEKGHNPPEDGHDVEACRW